MSRPIVFSYGGGRNGTALAVGAIARGLRPDYVLFADTGGERRWKAPDGELYERIEYVTMFAGWLQRHGWPGIHVVRQSKDGAPYTLEQHSLATKTLPSLAYGKRSCSVKFKHEPQEAFIDHFIPEGEFEHWLGYHVGERNRWLNLGTSNGREHFRYPLVEWKWDDTRCVEEILRAGLPDPGKSSCFFCPASKQKEVLALPEDHKRRAIAIEDNAPPKGVVKGLGGANFNWRRLIVFNDVQQSDMFRPSMPCGCYDGGSDDDEDDTPTADDGRGGAR